MTHQNQNFQLYWRKHALRMKGRHLTWNLKLSKLFFIMMRETTQWWRTLCKTMGTQPAAVLHERAGKGGADSTGYQWDRDYHLTFPRAWSPCPWCLCAETSSALPCSLPHPCLGLYSDTNCFSAEQHPKGMIMLNSNTFRRWRGFLLLPPSLAGYLTIKPIPYVPIPYGLQGFFCLLYVSYPHPKWLFLTFQCDLSVCSFLQEIVYLALGSRSLGYSFQLHPWLTL